MSEQRIRTADLWAQVLAVHLTPEDDYEVAALLESFGWTDERAHNQFGVATVFQLAKEIRRDSGRQVDLVANPYREKQPVWPVLRTSFSQFMRGIVFALPMVLSVIAMLTLRVSLWSYQYLSTTLATAIAIGTLLSFVTVGGFMQAMARQGYFYMFQGHYQMMRKMIFRLIYIGVGVSIAVVGLGLVLDAVLPELPVGMLVVTLLYYVVLNAIWLSVSVFYIFHRELWFTGMLLVGILIVYVAFTFAHVPILTAQLVTMFALAIAGLMMLRLFFKEAEAKLDKGINPPLPRFSVTAYSVAPYFIYGSLYFSFLFLDRILAWSTYAGYVPLVLWFRGDYELGLDFALGVLIVPIGMSEVIVSRLLDRIWSSQKEFLSREHRKMNSLFTRLYKRYVSAMLVLAAANGLVSFFIVQWVFGLQSGILNGRLNVDFVTRDVFLVATISYSVLSVGLLHAVVMFSLSRPELVVRPLVTALLINFAVGFLLTRWIDYPQAVWGLLAGSVYFTYRTSKNVQSVLRSLDYHMYLLS